MWATVSQPTLVVNARMPPFGFFNSMRPILTPSTASAGARQNRRKLKEERSVPCNVQHRLKMVSCHPRRASSCDKLRQWCPGHWRSPPRVCESFQSSLIPVSDLSSVQSQPPSRQFAHLHQLQCSIRSLLHVIPAVLWSQLCVSSPHHNVGVDDLCRPGQRLAPHWMLFSVVPNLCLSMVDGNAAMGSAERMGERNWHRVSIRHRVAGHVVECTDPVD